MHTSGEERCLHGSREIVYILLWPFPNCKIKIAPTSPSSIWTSSLTLSSDQALGQRTTSRLLLVYFYTKTEEQNIKREEINKWKKDRQILQVKQNRFIDPSHFLYKKAMKNDYLKLPITIAIQCSIMTSFRERKPYSWYGYWSVNSTVEYNRCTRSRGNDMIGEVLASRMSIHHGKT